MKKKVVSLLLAGVMIFGTCTSVYAEDYGRSFVANEMQLTAKSNSSTSYTHTHEYDARIKAYNVSFTKYIMVSADKVYKDTGVKKLETKLIPEFYSDSIYTGRYFKENQSCTITIRDSVKTYSEYIE